MGKFQIVNFIVNSNIMMSSLVAPVVSAYRWNVGETREGQDERYQSGLSREDEALKLCCCYSTQLRVYHADHSH